MNLHIRLKEEFENLGLTIRSGPWEDYNSTTSWTVSDGKQVGSTSELVEYLKELKDAD